MILNERDLITVEETTRVLEKFRISFSHGATVKLLHNGTLTKLPKPFKNVSDSRYGFGVSSKSLVKYLLSLGTSAERINELL